jgi:predicted transcriptional regulator
MFEKGLVRRDESTRPHVFRAAVAELQVKRRLVTDLLDDVFEGSSMGLVMQALSAKPASADELRQLRELLDQIETEIEGDRS